MALTFRHLFRGPITTQYPEERLASSHRMRGNDFIWEQALCTGCATCAKACPIGCITVVTHPDTERYVVDRYEIDGGRCLFCGLCVEACPFRALYLTREFERARYRRRELVYDMERLTAPGKRVSAYRYPAVEADMPRQTLLVYGETKES